jgi:polyphosphate kinase
VYFISSGDWLPRNFDGRVEVAAPVYATKLQQQLRDYFDIQWQDNCKARIWDKELSNRFRTPEKGEPLRRSQLEMQDYYAEDNTL